MKTNDEMVAALIATGALRTRRIIDAFRATDRAKFVRPEYLGSAYEDIPLPIGFGATISQPYTVAVMLELLAPDERSRVLDVGSGSGWTTGLLGAVVGEHGAVLGVEIVPELVEWGKANVREFEKSPVGIVLAREDTLGAPEYGPYDRILVSAEASSIPEELLGQLSPEGVMVLPVAGELVRVKKRGDGNVEKSTHGEFRFVPLQIPSTDQYGTSR